jgi:hypothetical protein
MGVSQVGIETTDDLMVGVKERLPRSHLAVG